LRFLNLKLSSPDISDIKIVFSEGLNIISISDKELFTLFKHIPIAGMYGIDQSEIKSAFKKISCTINVSTASGQEICFINESDNFIVKEYDASGERLQIDEEEIQKPDKYGNICTLDDFMISSCFFPEQIQKNIDPVFEREKLKSLFVTNEISRLNISFFKYRETLMQEKEKELIDLGRDKQLLELKKIKKEKLLKEINISERSIQKLEKRKESINRYKSTLNEIISKNESRNKLSSKINNIKKDLIELREIKEKINSVENTLQKKFSHFSEKGNDQLPDLEQIQESFNSFRDINEQLDKFFLSKKNYTGWALKIIASMIIFSLIAFIFMLFSSSASFVLGITSGVAAAGAGIIGLLYQLKIRKLHPSELFEQKKKLENNLIDLLKKNNVSVDDCRTGELYEILFQYFEDFINYRDIRYELLELKKKLSNSSSLIEKEKKLERLIDEIENFDKEINETINNLDLSIHPRPEQDDISRAIHNIDELLEENETEINDKKTLIAKFEEEIEEYDKIENSSLSAELKFDEILKQIDECRERIEHIKFLDDVFEEAAESWVIQKLEELLKITVEKFLKLTDNSFIKEDITDSINSLLLNSTKLKSEHRRLKKYISFSIKAALSELLDRENLPPVFIIDPFTPDNEFADNMKKLLPELFPERQVIVIIQGKEPELKGNLINL